MNERFTIILEPLPDKPGTSPMPVEVRLRQALKLLLRGFGLRAVDVQERPPPAARAANDGEEGAGRPAHFRAVQSELEKSGR